VGIAHGYATLGMIGFESRVDYAAIGQSPTSPLACVLRPRCQILISQRVYVVLKSCSRLSLWGNSLSRAFCNPCRCSM